MANINISHLSKAKLLAALYRGAKQQGLGVIHHDVADMTTEQAEKLLADKTSRGYFDYIQGRVLKVDLSKDMLDTFLYNRDNGEGKAEQIIKALEAEN